MLKKHLLSLPDKPFRLNDITIWPVTFFLSIGLLTTFLSKDPRYLAVTVMATIAWRALHHFSQGINQLCIEEYFDTASEYLLASPVETKHFVIAGTIIGAIKMAVIITLIALTATLFFQFPPISIPALAGAIAINAVFGVQLGLILLGLTYTYGNESAVASYIITDAISILSAAFFPIALLPWPMQAIALLLPSTHAFALIKASQGIEAFNPIAAIATLTAWLVAAILIHNYLLKNARKKGTLVRIK